MELVDLDIRRQLAAYHESGHHVMFRHSSIPVVRVEVYPDGSGGVTEVADRDVETALVDSETATRLLLGVLAGQYAEGLGAQEVGFYVEHSCRSDDRWLSDILRRRKDLGLREQKLRSIANQLVVAQWNEIRDFADDLLKWGRICP